MQIGRIEVKASRWPWQKRGRPALVNDLETEGEGMPYGWFPTKGAGRFGGGWNWALGFTAGGTCIIFNLLFGLVRISWSKEKKTDG